MGRLGTAPARPWLSFPTLPTYHLPAYPVLTKAEVAPVGFPRHQVLASSYHNVKRRGLVPHTSDTTLGNLGEEKAATFAWCRYGVCYVYSPPEGTSSSTSDLVSSLPLCPGFIVGGGHGLDDKPFRSGAFRTGLVSVSTCQRISLMR